MQRRRYSMLENMRPDPTFYASPKLAMEAPAENYAYVLMLSPDGSQPDALGVVDVQLGSSTYGTLVHTVAMPNKGDEFHHFGWNACSSALSPLTGHAFSGAGSSSSPACARRESTSSTPTRIRRKPSCTR